MEFLKDIALPQPAEHVQLLLFMLNLVLITLLPYFGFMLGASTLSLLFRRRARSTSQRERGNRRVVDESGDPLELRFSRDLITTAVFSKSGVTFLAVIPALTLVFLLAQFLQSTPAIAASLMGFGFLALLASAILLYAYAYTFRLSGILRAVDASPGGTTEELRNAIAANEHVHGRTGRWGLICAYTASILLVGSITVVGNPQDWADMETVFDLFLSAEFWLRYGQFLAVAAGATGVGILFFFLSWQGGLADPAEAYGQLIIKTGVRLGGASLLLLPIFIVGTIALTPVQGLSGVVFGLTALSITFLFITAHMVYAYWKEGRSGYVSYAFFALGVALVLLFTKDQVAISNAVQEHAVNLASVAEKEREDLKSRLGIVAKAMSGADIYNAKCSACHMFDQKRIGPPYKEVIPKYQGKMAELVAFIMNPVKVNPAYPNMPNQGLKPAEADSIAHYLVEKVMGKPSPPSAAQPKPNP